MNIAKKFQSHKTLLAFCYIRQSIKTDSPIVLDMHDNKDEKKAKFTSIHVHVGMIEKGENNSICKLTVFSPPTAFLFSHDYVASP